MDSFCSFIRISSHFFQWQGSFVMLACNNLQAQAMKEQAQLREEMAYQYKLGNFKVRIT